MNLIAIPILQDNYVWLLTDTNHTIIIDPGVAQPVIDYLQKNECLPTAILLTHHHDDHTAGVEELLKSYPNLIVYGPQETVGKGANQIIKNGDRLKLGSLVTTVFSVPGHTLGHVAYYCEPYLFCGDTLFSGGCGRVFEGTLEQMYSSLIRLYQLPDDTYICCSHEYTLSNLNFAHSLVPEDDNIARALIKTQKLRQHNQATLPSTLSTEKKINIFLRCSEKPLKQALLGNNNNASDLDFFIFLRNKKDHF